MNRSVITEGIKMHKLKVHLGERSYDILIDNCSLDLIGVECKKLLVRDEVWLISDKNIMKYYEDDLVCAFDKVNVKLNMLNLPCGEATKSINFLEKISDWLIKSGVERGDLIIAFGGGVIGDLVGFVSAVTLRGIDFIQVPTTLLSQVDSSVGGKTGINSKFGKNLIGCFYQPRKVLIFTDVLKTLSERELRSGYSEIIKYGLLGDNSFFSWLEKNGHKVLALESESIHEAIYRSCKIKAEIVSLDERETGSRALLNLGHTFAHAFEAAVGYNNKLLHGEAVSIGLIIAIKISIEMGFCEADILEKVRDHFKNIGLKTRLSDVDFSFPSSDELVNLMLMDKKVTNGLINFVMIKGIGTAFVTNSVDLGLVKDVIDSSR